MLSQRDGFKIPCFTRILSHNGRVSCRRLLIVSPLLALLAGCAPQRIPPDVDMSPAPEKPVTKPLPTTPPPLKVNPVTNTAPAVPAAAPPPAVPPVRPTESSLPFPSETWVRFDHWAETHGFGETHRIQVDNGFDYSVASPHGTLIVRLDSNIATWRGTQLYLGFSPQLIKGHLCVHRLDIINNLLPLMAPASLRPAHHVIVIDPGHGGMDTGTRSLSNGRSEKEFTLDWAQRLQELLIADGWTVWLTRSNDTALPLPARVAIADEHHADVFLSLHFNSLFPNLQEAGLETYSLTPQGMPSNLTRGYEDNPSLAFPNNQFNAQNLEYAMMFHRAILKVNGFQDRGVRHARFPGVLKNQNRPAVLIEGGYLSNPAESKRIADPAYRQKLAEAVASVLKLETNTVAQVASRSNAPAAGISNNVAQ